MLGFEPMTCGDEESQNYYHATAKDEKDAGELIDKGFSYVCTTPQNIMLFRKPKVKHVRGWWVSKKGWRVGCNPPSVLCGIRLIGLPAL